MPSPSSWLPVASPRFGWGGGGLEAIEIGRFVGAVSKVGPYGGKSGGEYYRPPSEASKAYIEKFGIPYGSW